MDPNIQRPETKGYISAIGARNTKTTTKIKVQPTIIKFGDQLFKTVKGKSIWKTPGHAKSALSNDVDNYLYSNKTAYWALSTSDKKEIVDQIKAAAEFVSVDITEEILVNLKF